MAEHEHDRFFNEVLFFFLLLSKHFAYLSFSAFMGMAFCVELMLMEATLLPGGATPSGRELFMKVLSQ